jgi:branched-chain amino acid transport system permease protein
VGTLTFFPITIDSDQKFYFVVMPIAMLMFILARNIINSDTGRSFKAIMDSEVSASTSGINVAKYKIIAFAISSFYAGIAGAIYAQYQSFISPEIFNIMLSIDFIVMIVIGGMSTIYGAIIGAAFVRFLPEILQTINKMLPGVLNADVAFLFYSAIYGILMLLFILYIPSGIYGSAKNLYFRIFPP